MTFKNYYFLRATRLPLKHPQRLSMDHGDEVVIGERGRLCRYGSPKLFRTEREAEDYAAGFLKNKSPHFDLRIVTTTGPMSRSTGLQLAEETFVDHNYYLKVTKVPETLFVTRENLRSLFVAGNLVVGKNSSLAKMGRQRWFQTHIDALAHMQKITQSAAFTGYEFEIVSAN